MKQLYTNGFGDYLSYWSFHPSAIIGLIKEIKRAGGTDVDPSIWSVGIQWTQIILLPAGMITKPKRCIFSPFHHYWWSNQLNQANQALTETIFFDTYFKKRRKIEMMTIPGSEHGLTMPNPTSIFTTLIFTSLSSLHQLPPLLEDQNPFSTLLQVIDF